MEEFFQTLIERIAGWVPGIGLALAVALGFWILSWVLSSAVKRLASRTELHRNAQLIALLGRTARVTLLVLGAVTALGTLGVNVSGLVAGLGLTGFAFRDMISNLLAGVLILVYRPFDVGDDIDFKGLKGKVLHVDLRYTALDAEGERILIPNANLFAEPIRINKMHTSGLTSI